MTSPESHSPSEHSIWSCVYPCLLFVFALVVFWKITLTRDYSILTYPDSSVQSYAWFQYIARTLHAHSFPFWDPYVEAGHSFIGEAQTAAFYPLNLLLGLVPLNARGHVPAMAIELLVVVHCFLGSLFVYWLARHFGLPRFSAFVAGLVFAYSGSVGIRSFGQINIAAASIWVPAVFLFYSKSLHSVCLLRQVLFANLSGLCLGLSLLAGHHQPFIYCSMALLVSAMAILIFRRVSLIEPAGGPVSRWAVIWTTVAVFVFAVAYSAPQLLPSLQYAHHAYRAVGEDQIVLASRKVPYNLVGNRNTFPPQGLIDFVFPYLVNVENNPYLGILPLLFVPLTISLIRKSSVVRLLWFLAAFFLLLSLADYTPLHGILYAVLPEYGKARETARSLLMVHFALSLLAGFGCQIFFRPISRLAKKYFLLAIWLFSGVTLAIVLAVFGGYFYRTSVLAQSADYNSFFFTSILFLLAGGLALARVYGRFDKRALQIVAVVICLLDYHQVLSPHIRSKSGFDGKTNLEPTQYYRPDPILQFLKNQSGIYRVDLWAANYPQNIGEVLDFDTITGHGATIQKRFKDLLTARDYPRDNISRVLNVRYFVAERPLSLPKVLQSGKKVLYEDPDYLPRAWVVSEVRSLPDENQVVNALRHPSFDPRAEALVEGSGPAQVLGSGRSFSADVPQVAFQRHDVNGFSLEVRLSNPAFLVVSEMWYPGWRAWVDGTPAQVRLTDGALMGLYLGAGKSRIDFSFLPSHFYLALGLTGIACAVLLFTLAWPWITRPGERRRARLR